MVNKNSADTVVKMQFLNVLHTVCGTVRLYKNNLRSFFSNTSGNFYKELVHMLRSAELAVLLCQR